MPKQTYYIVPAFSDQAGQCRIVVCDGAVANARDSYRAHPDLWKEAGIMNSRGELVCLEAPKHVWNEIQDCCPLMAGTQFIVDKEALAA